MKKEKKKGKVLQDKSSQVKTREDKSRYGVSVDSCLIFFYTVHTCRVE